jgi:hypothetical protein
MYIEEETKGREVGEARSMDNLKKLFAGKNLAFLLLLVLLVASIGSAVYFYSQFTQLKQDPQKTVREETQKLLERVGALMVLPEGEQPTIATVNDAEKLRSQPFFANAKNGYKVFIYANAKKAILFDPANNKIVEVAPVNIGNTSAPKPPSE